MKFINNIRTKIGITISSILSALGAGGGGASAVCQTTCSTTSGILPFLGVSLSATPFAFIEDYQKPIWLIAGMFFLLLFILYVRNKVHPPLDKVLLFLNGGLLLIGFPYLKELLFIKLLPLAGILIIIVGLGLYMRAKKIKVVFAE